MEISVKTISLGAANAFIAVQDPTQPHVRHCYFCIGAFVDGRLSGIAVVGRPRLRCVDARRDALELTRIYTEGDRATYTALVAEAKRRTLATGAMRLVPSLLAGCACALCAERAAA